MKFIALAFIAATTMGVSSCRPEGKLESLCIMNFTDKMCWVNKSKGIGFSFQDMAQDQIKCRKEGSNTACWYAIDADDIERIAKKLNECSVKPQGVSDEAVYYPQSQQDSEGAEGAL